MGKFSKLKMSIGSKKWRSKINSHANFTYLYIEFHLANKFNEELIHFTINVALTTFFKMKKDRY